jgi:hypothetical protein
MKIVLYLGKIKWGTSVCCRTEVLLGILTFLLFRENIKWRASLGSETEILLGNMILLKNVNKWESQCWQQNKNLVRKYADFLFV